MGVQVSATVRQIGKTTAEAKAREHTVPDRPARGQGRRQPAAPWAAS